MAINTFDNQSTVRIGRTVRSYEKSVLGKPNLSNRRIPISGGKGGAQSTFKAKIKTYTVGTGVYTVDIYNNGYNEPATSTDVLATPTITTFTPLGIGEKAIVMIDEVETLGDNEN
jgi:hypothetical protein